MGMAALVTKHVTSGWRPYGSKTRHQRLQPKKTKVIKLRLYYVVVSIAANGVICAQWDQLTYTTKPNFIFSMAL